MITKREAVIISAYTGYLLCSFNDMQIYIEEKMGRPVFVHELPFIEDEIRELATSDFMALEIEK